MNGLLKRFENLKNRSRRFERRSKKLKGWIFLLRRMNLEDASTLVTINTSQLGYEASLPDTLNRMNKLLGDAKHHYFLVYEDSNSKKVAGYVHAECYESLYAEPMFNILALAVANEYKGQGIGKQLMLGVEKEALKRNLVAVRLNSGETRTQAHLFYEKIGYTSNKSQKRFIKFL